MENKKFKMPTSITTLLVLLILVSIFTYIIPAGEYLYKNGTPISGSYKTVDSNPQGIWEIIAAPIEGFKSAIDIILFVLVLGGCLGVLFETKSIDAGLAAIIKKFNGREKFIIPLIMFLCSMGGSIYGMSEETISFYPIITPILLAAGYDVVTSVMVIFLGCGVGVAGAILNPFSVGIASGLAGISLADGIIVRLIAYLFYVIFAIVMTMRYAEKVKNDPSKSIVYDIRDKCEAPFKKISMDGDIEFTFRRKLVVGIFIGMFIIMIIGIIPWSSKFSISFFEDFDHKLKSIPYFGSLIGNTIPLGNWYFKEMSMLFFIGSIIIGFVYGMKEAHIVKSFMSGCKDILGVAITLAVAKSVSIIMQDGLIIGTILNFGENIIRTLDKTFFPAIIYLVYIPLSFVIPSSSGLATATIPIFAPVGEFVGVGKEFIVLAFSAGAESMNFISPTQAVLVGALALTNIPYQRWLKHVLPFFFGIIFITVVILTVSNILLE
ncbi:hypothetical protein [Brachyspira sp.]|uniref:YfcC family protein n=1 Tax=Brachyspira sp. TaxID=1977261 RepID=UPI0026059AB1|nr:hypothetical protein [Brachyspira sp.]